MATAPAQTVNVSIRNDVTDLLNVADIVDRVGVEAGIPTRTVIQLQVVLDEILSNIIKYAWPEGESHEFAVGIDVRDGGVEITITDDGRPFNPLAQTAPKSSPPGRRPAPGGVGIHLVGQLVDGFKYARVDGRNLVTLTKRYNKDLPVQQGETHDK
jgi:serine/threonine-protein kinase RsbW